MAKNSYIPESDHTISALLEFKGIDAAFVWYKNVLGAEENMRLQGPDKKIISAELGIGDSVIFLEEKKSQNNNRTSQSMNGNSKRLHVYVRDVDEIIKKALQNGAKLVMPAEDQLYGDRYGCIGDPFGYTWVLATHIKDISKN